ncbi:hypothetical protein FQR65_LT17344 [Abscondita terminalis]|nr:hypothetical protein FQR65_LT17344 [Abscondita terminalis]
MVMCFAPTCKHYSEKQGCKFFVFPKQPVELKKWLQAIRRKDRRPGPHSRICSCHFVEGNKENGPTIFDYNVTKRFTYREIEIRKRVKKEVPQPCTSEEESAASTSRGEPSTELPTEKLAEELSGATMSQFPALVEGENYFLKQEYKVDACDIPTNANVDRLVYPYVKIFCA